MSCRRALAAAVALAALAALATGCSSPGEPGCAECCAEGAGRCVMFASSNPLAIDAWYNVARYSAPPCAPSCAPCAPCSAAERAALFQAEQRTLSCDCAVEYTAALASALDPCYDSSSCACACATRAALSACAAS